MKIFKKDIKILSYLRKNSRERLTKISKKTGVPVSTIFDRMRMHYSGLIQKYTTLINFQVLGFNSKACIILKIDRDQRENLKEFISQSQCINSAYKINNGYDFFIEVISKNMRELEDFVEQLEEKFIIREKHVFYIVEDIKREDFLTTEELIDSMFPKDTISSKKQG